VFNVKNTRARALKPTDKIFVGGRSFHAGRVTPPTLADTLKADTQNAYIYTCLVNWGPFHSAHRNFWQYLGLARWKPIPLEYSFNVLIHVPPDALQMTPAYKERYFTNEEGVIDRIYTPVDLIQYLHQQPLTVQPQGGFIGGRLDINPPLGPWLALAGIVFIVLLVIGGGLWFICYPLQYQLTDTLGQSIQRKVRFGSKRMENLEYHTTTETIQLGVLERKGPFSFVFRPEEGVQVISPEGQIIIGHSEEGVEEKRSEVHIESVENQETPIFRQAAPVSVSNKRSKVDTEPGPVNEIELKSNERWVIRLLQLETQLELERLNAYL
jgi:hypothetical protein